MVSQPENYFFLSYDVQLLLSSNWIFVSFTVKPSDASLQDGSPSCKIPKTEDPSSSHEFGSGN